MTRHLAAFLLAAAVAPLGAQGTRADEVPSGFQPPAGMCRVWLDGVPASQQPAPTDCSSAMRSRPARSKVLIGDRPAAGGLPASAFNAGSAAYQGAPASTAPGIPRARPFADLDEAAARRIQHGDLCLDADHDGLCDDTAPAVAGCVDANRDGKCDEPRRDIMAAIEAGVFRTGSAISGICIDRNRDGKCDETWLAADVCLDRDGDGKCDGPMASAFKAAELVPRVEPAPAAPEKVEKAPKRAAKRPE